MYTISSKIWIEFVYNYIEWINYIWIICGNLRKLAILIDMIFWDDIMLSIRDVYQIMGKQFESFLNFKKERGKIVC